jgi:hypothetical protein
MGWWCGRDKRRKSEKVMESVLEIINEESWRGEYKDISHENMFDLVNKVSCICCMTVLT